MEFFEVIRRWRSFRAFCNMPIATEMLEWILGAANVVPPAGNLLAYEVYVVPNYRSRFGSPAEEPASSERRPLNDLVHHME